jgi:hypothetical protein
MLDLLFSVEPATQGCGGLVLSPLLNDRIARGSGFVFILGSLFGYPKPFSTPYSQEGSKHSE